MKKSRSKQRSGEGGGGVNGGDGGSWLLVGVANDEENGVMWDPWLDGGVGGGSAT